MPFRPFGRKRPAPAPDILPESSVPLVTVDDFKSFALLCFAGCLIWLSCFAKNVPTSDVSAKDPRVLPPFQAWRLASAAAFAANVVFVSLPGRFDGDEEALQDGRFPWDTLFAPAGYAFSIWAIVFIGEAVGVVYNLRMNNEREQSKNSKASSANIKVEQGTSGEIVPPSVGAAAPAWCAANLAQCLWCLAFRPWALERLWLSSAMLATTAVCLCASQVRLGGGLFTICTRPDDTPVRTASIVTVPRSLHLGWVTAATLVNINAWVGRVHSAKNTSSAYASFSSSDAYFNALNYSWLASCSTDADVLAVAILSVVASAVASLAYSLVYGLPAAGGAVSWALLALAYGTPVGVAAEGVGGSAREALAKAEAALAAATFAVAVAVAVRAPKPKQIA